MNLSMEAWYVIASVAATLIVQAAHARGIRLPLVESVLDWITRYRAPTPSALPDTLRVQLPNEQTVRPEIVQAADGQWLLRWQNKK